MDVWKFPSISCHRYSILSDSLSFFSVVFKESLNLSITYKYLIIEFGFYMCMCFLADSVMLECVLFVLLYTENKHAKKLG